MSTSLATGALAYSEVYGFASAFPRLTAQLTPAAVYPNRTAFGVKLAWQGGELTLTASQCVTFQPSLC